MFLVTREKLIYISDIDSMGTYTLTGNQVLAYPRIRCAIGRDYVRADGQRTVLNLIIYKMK